MFSKELENLIQATLEDGVLEDYEMAALERRAKAEGVDLVELEIYINSILQKRRKEKEDQKNAEFDAIEKKKKEAIGKVCPNCGKQVHSLSLNCSCGFEFQQEKRQSAIESFFEKYSNLQLTEEELKVATIDNGEAHTIHTITAEKLKNRKQIDFINSFPVPNTKEDIMEFLAMAAPRTTLKGGMFGTMLGRIKIILFAVIIVVIIAAIYALIAGEDVTVAVGFSVASLIMPAFLLLMIDQETLRANNIAMAFREKFEQVLMKGRSLRTDAEFIQLLDYYENIVKSKQDEKKFKLPF